MRILSTLWAAAFVVLPTFVTAQEVKDVKFAPGDYGALVQGKITGQSYIDYRLGAKAGQEIFAELTVTQTNGDGTVYFNILPPGSNDVALYNGSMDGTTARVRLPKSGVYTVRVYHMGNDEDTGKTSAFNLDFSIQN